MEGKTINVMINDFRVGHLRVVGTVATWRV